MKNQLVLLEDAHRVRATQADGSRGHQWVLDEHTRDIGRRGVAQAREALRRAAAQGVPASRAA